MENLAKFLEVNLTETLKHEIMDMCSFEKMSKEKVALADDIGHDAVKNGFNFYRKGK